MYWGKKKGAFGSILRVRGSRNEKISKTKAVEKRSEIFWRGKRSARDDNNPGKTTIEQVKKEDSGQRKRT